VADLAEMLAALLQKGEDRTAHVVLMALRHVVMLAALLQKGEETEAQGDIRKWTTTGAALRKAVHQRATTSRVVPVRMATEKATLAEAKVRLLTEIRVADVVGLRCRTDDRRSHTVDPVQAVHRGCTVAHRLVLAHRSVTRDRDVPKWDHRG
jgi:hypothetical protein